MRWQALQHSIQTYLGLLALVVAATASGGDPGGEPAKELKDKTAPGSEIKGDAQPHRAAEQVIRGIDMEMLSDEQWTRVERIEKPLLFFSDPTRNNDRGSVWGWGRKGRPVAVLELYQDLDKRMRWVFAVCNTSGGKLRGRRAGAPWWHENESATELKNIPGAPAPAAEAPQRQRQLKLLAEKFTGHQLWDPDNTRYELRLLKRPLYTYRDEANGVLDGGLFTLANGTNPEILLFIEARADPKDRAKSVWQYAVGRLAHAELHMEYDGKEIFDAPRTGRLSGSDKPYWAAFIQADVDADQKKP
jgi:hypothetical protein